MLKISENASSQDVRAAPIQIQNISKSMERMADRAIGQWRCEESILGDRRCNAVDKFANRHDLWYEDTKLINDRKSDKRQ
jgi:hypothetical protein